jgi:hypothetical protein
LISLTRTLCGQRLVCLTFADSKQLYSHPVALALASGVLRNVLEDTQAQHQQKEGADLTDYSTIPLDDGPDTAAAWQTTLAFLHHQGSLKVSMDNAQTLLLLADKYEIPCIAGGVP